MAALSSYLFFIPLLIFSLLYLKSRYSSARRQPALRLPPEPWPLPVLGHMHHLVGALPHQRMRDLARRHGPLMLLRLGEAPAVVASSPDAAREIMKTHDIVFATRPIGPTAAILLKDTEGLIFARYGDRWRQLRKICTLELLSAKRVLSFRPTREEEVGRLLRSIAASSSPPPTRPLNLTERISAYVADSAVRAIMGSRFRDRDTFLRLLEEGLKIVPGLTLPDLFPSSRLARTFSTALRRMGRQRAAMFAFVGTIIQEHQENRAAGGGNTDEDLIDVLLRIQADGDLQFPLTTEDIKAVIIDMFGAGSETSATTLQWAMAELMRNPRVMRKAQEEVRRALTGQQKVTEEGLGDMHYLRLVIKETLRLHPPAPLLLPRECQSPCRVLGYDVPKGAMVVVNAWAMGRDPGLWDAAEEFAPERFKGSGVDFKGNDFHYIPFGAGRRICPGMLFGLANMELALASLLFHFDWELPGGTPAGELDMTEGWGMTARRRSDLLVIAVPRVPVPTA